MRDWSNIYGKVEPEHKHSWIVQIVHADDGKVLFEQKYETSTAANSIMKKKLTWFLTHSPEYSNAKEELDFDDSSEPSNRQ